jgi:SagB-type dehydrogenase family enzyme
MLGIIMGNTVWREFMESTKYRNIGETDEVKGLPHPPLEWAIDPDKSVINLVMPKMFKYSNIGLREAIEARKSVREYNDEPLTLSELSWLLWCTQGVKKVTERPATLRTVPSAGSRHPFETFLLVNRVEDLEAGLYRFVASQHKLEVIDLDESLIEEFAKANWSAQMIRSCAVTFIWVAIRYRMTYKYGNRGFRYLHLDAGHLCQNLYLATAAIQSGTCAVGGFLDDKVNTLLDLDGEEQFVIYMATVGKKIQAIRAL